MALLDEHEAVLTETIVALYANGSTGAALLEKFRTSRRMLVAAYDRSGLRLTSGFSKA